ncbi:MAG: Endonuclease/Exonuclease/phosphatase family protein, partial [Lacunisphaera sp.]|nr:Endonuclease/Exonuclease/phosphatase family protein [Lacunisphaera sp.]
DDRLNQDTASAGVAIATLPDELGLRPMTRLRLLTFNIAHARGALPLHQSLRSEAKIRSNLVKIARLIQRLNADVVALQEIDENSRWNGSFDHLAFLSAHTGLAHAVHGVNNRRGGRFHLNYGNAILSRFPIVHSETTPFGFGKLGGKGFVFAEIEVPKKGRLPVVNVHLHHASRAERLRQSIRLVHYLDEQRKHRAAQWHTPLILCGDFNNPSHQPDATATLLNYFELTNHYMLLPKTGRTFPSLLPARALDYVFLPEECREPKAEVVRSLASDHCPVLVEFSLP